VRIITNAYNILVGTPERVRPLSGPRRGEMIILKFDLKELRYGMWTVLGGQEDQWRDLVDTVIDL
jgi:hypothetical protein